MSILIKGMEMPTSCDDCEFCKRAMSGYDWCCIPMANGRDKPLDEPVIKPDWCPLVPVPPHGDLIDRDALTFCRIRIAHPDGIIGGYNAVVMSAEINNAPIIVPAEDGE